MESSLWLKLSEGKACLQVCVSAATVSKSLPENHSIQFGRVCRQRPCMLAFANTMPLDQPGSLGIPQVTALMAHIFNENGMPAGDKPLEGDVDWLMTVSLARPPQ